MTHLAIRSGEGFIALITAIILGVVLMVVAISLSTTGYFTRGQVVDAEYKERSRSLAEACVHVALLRLAANPSDPGLVTVTIGSDSCAIGAISKTGSIYTIPTEAVFPASAFMSQAFTYLLIEANDIASNLSIAEWKECPTSATC